MSAMEVSDDEDRSSGEEISTPPESAPLNPTAQVRLCSWFIRGMDKTDYRNFTFIFTG